MKGTKIILLSAMNLINIIMVSGKSCTDKSALNRCRCEPLCASDGYTYTDKCFLDAYNKACDKDVKAVSVGPCKGKTKLVPVTPCYPANGVCTKSSDDPNKPKLYDPICSKSGDTYGNSCAFHNSRIINPQLEFAKCGEC